MIYSTVCTYEFLHFEHRSCQISAHPNMSISSFIVYIDKPVFSLKLCNYILSQLRGSRKRLDDSVGYAGEGLLVDGCAGFVSYLD
jgi:hypothetical protein